MKRLLGGALFASVAAASATSNPASRNPLSNAQVIALVKDLSANAPRAVEVTSAALAGKLPDDNPYAETSDEAPVFSALAAGLTESGRMISLDWAEGMEESKAEFAALFEKAGLGAEKPLAELTGKVPVERGDAVGLVYLAFRPVADAAGMRIFGLNADSDTHHFVLVPVAVAERWQSVKIGDNQYLEDSDWQFLALIETAGIKPRSTRHPADSERPAPAIP